MINTELELNKDQLLPSHEKGEYTVLWTVPPHLSYFEGHFPGNPILMGVAIIDVSLVFLGNIKNATARLSEIKNSKFLNPVSPGVTVKISAQMKEANRFMVKWKDADRLLVELDLVIQ